jgi:hypothetical protein
MWGIKSALVLEKRAGSETLVAFDLSIARPLMTLHHAGVGHSSL